MNQKQAYEMMLQRRLQVWSVEIENLKDRTNVVDPRMRVAAEDKITELYARQRLAREKLATVRASGVDGWKHLRADANAAANSLSHALRSMQAQL